MLPAAIIEADRFGAGAAWMEDAPSIMGMRISLCTWSFPRDGRLWDFGYGFYGTESLRQAKRWALTRRQVSGVTYTESSGLDVLSFPEMSEEWLDFIVSCRRGSGHDHDIVEGLMADNRIWNYVEDFVAGEITREAFWELVIFRHPTHQIAFCTEDAPETLRFEGADER
jgi:hypothetical protein